MLTMVKQLAGVNRSGPSLDLELPRPVEKQGQCPRGSAGCRCAPGRTCEGALTCQWDTCWGGDTQPPESYYYSERGQKDPDEIRALIVTHLDLKPGDHVADIGCGTGQVTLELAQRVGPTGRVYATDIDPKTLEVLPTTLASLSRTAMASVETRLAATIRGTGLSDVPDGSLALILMINSAHFERAEPAEEARAYVAGFLRKLAPGGRLIYHYDWLDSNRMTRAEQEALFTSAGFATKVTEIPMPTHIPAESYVLRGGNSERARQELRRGFILVFHRPAGEVEAPGTAR
jgi:SAM-dependent methyltransferase